MQRNPTGVLVRVSAVIGLLACLGVFTAGLLQEPEAPRTAMQDDPVAQEFQRGQQAAGEQRWKDAIASFEKVVEQQPQHAGAWFQLAYAVHASGDYKRAIGLHEKAAGFRQSAPTALYNLACAHALLGHTDEAFSALDRAIAAGFVSAEVAKNDSDLRSIRNDERFEAALGKMRAGPINTLLHFWVGEWDVYGASNGGRAGTNRLSLRNQDRFILEQWTDSQGNTGESFNYYDPREGVWKQVWSDAGGLVEFVGRRHENGILFEGERVGGQGPASRVRMFVRPIAEGRVRQTGTRWNDESQEWEPRYDLVYVPKGEPLDKSADAED